MGARKFSACLSRLALTPQCGYTTGVFTSKVATAGRFSMTSLSHQSLNQSALTQSKPLLCLGVDPCPAAESLAAFESALARHSEAIIRIGPRAGILKPNLAFFLRYGSRGIGLLESFVGQFASSHRIILDGKFGEIANTLDAYLHFVFKTLQAHGTTINPFLGEKTLTRAFEACANQCGTNGRVYVLCATSEGGTSHLRGFQEHFLDVVRACQEAHRSVCGDDPSLSRLAGVVIGANRTEILTHAQIQASGLSILAPGLGAQGAPWPVTFGQPHQEITWPLSRGVFGAGDLSVNDMLLNFEKAWEHFEPALPASAFNPIER